MNISMNKSVLRRAAQQMAEQLAAALPEEERTASADGFEAQAAQLLHQEEYRRKGRWGWRRGIAAVLAAVLPLGRGRTFALHGAPSLFCVAAPWYAPRAAIVRGTQVWYTIAE